MRPVLVLYDHEADSGWTAESPDAPGYMAYADSFDEVRRLAHEGLRLFFEGEDIVILDPTIPLVNAGPAEAATTVGGRRPTVPGTYQGTIGPLEPVAA
jgi:predicted RNase H-like HicB family nuclease